MDDSPFPREGLTIAAIRTFLLESGCAAADAANIAAGGSGLSTSDVCAHFIVPATLKAGSSLCACLAAAGSLEVGPATVFVSHTWSYRFEEVIAALAAWATGRSPQPFFWFDIFSNSQHNTSERPFAWWVDIFRRNVGNIGHTLVVMDRYMKPVSRAWCVWEMACSITEHARLDVISLPSAAAALREAQGFMQSFRCHVEWASAFLPADKENILSAIRETIGFVETNRIVSAAFHVYMGQEMCTLLNELPPTERGSSELLVRAAQTVASDGNIHSGSAEYDVMYRSALALLEEAIAARTSHFGEASAQAALAQVSMLTLAKRAGDAPRVEATARALIRIRGALPGTLDDGKHEDGAYAQHVISNLLPDELATAICMQGRGVAAIEEVLPCFEEIVTKRASALAALHEEQREAFEADVCYTAGPASDAREASSDDEDGDDNLARIAAAITEGESLVDGSLVPLVALLKESGREAEAITVRMRLSAGAFARSTAAPVHAHALAIGGAMPFRGTRVIISRLNSTSCCACLSRNISAAFVAVCSDCEYIECVLCTSNPGRLSHDV